MGFLHKTVIFANNIIVELLMYKILFDVLVSSILYASVLSLLVTFFKSYYAKYPIFSSVMLYVLFVVVCGVSILFPIAIHEYILYNWIYQSLLIIYVAYVSLSLLLFLPLNWWRLMHENIYLPQRLRYLDKYQQRLAKDIHLRKKIILHIHKNESSPFTWGWLRPIISFPQMAVEKLSHLQIKSLLLHELVHIKKKDYLVGIFLYVIHCLFVFNPFVRWWVIEVRFLQEVVCDKRVIKRYSIKEYIEALLLFTKNNNKFSFLRISVNYDLYNRIALMLGEQKLKFNKSIKYTSLVSCALLFFFVHLEDHHYTVPHITRHKIQVTKIESQSIPIFANTPTKSPSKISKTSKSCITQICVDTPSTMIVAKNEECMQQQTEDVDISAHSVQPKNNYQYIHTIKNKKYILPQCIDKDSLILSMVSKATFMLISCKDVVRQYPYISKILTSQQIRNIQIDSKSPESIQLLNYFMNLMYKKLQLHIEDIDWQVLNMRLDNQVVDIILTQQDCQ